MIVIIIIIVIMIQVTATSCPDDYKSLGDTTVKGKKKVKLRVLKNRIHQHFYPPTLPQTH